MKTMKRMKNGKWMLKLFLLGLMSSAAMILWAPRSFAMGRSIPSRIGFDSRGSFDSSAPTAAEAEKEALEACRKVLPKLSIDDLRPTITHHTGDCKNAGGYRSEKMQWVQYELDCASECVQLETIAKCRASYIGVNPVVTRTFWGQPGAFNDCYH